MRQVDLIKEDNLGKEKKDKVRKYLLDHQVKGGRGRSKAGKGGGGRGQKEGEREGRGGQIGGIGGGLDK